ncbi:MAG: DinB family protein [Chitinophagaceae bacterium]
MPRPLENEYASFYKNYVALATGNNIDEVIANHSEKINEFYNNLPESKADYAYANGKWTIKDLLQHLIDAERVFVYRATRFARKDNQDLLGFEENDYAANANAGKRSLQGLKNELTALRSSTNLFLQSLDVEQLQQTGKANNHTISVNAIAFIVFGHLLHHKNIIQERYL